MKKLFLIAAVAVSGLVSAQTENGKLMFSGRFTNLGFSSANSKSEYSGVELGEAKTTNLQFNPSFGYFVIDNLYVGLSSQIGSTKITVGEDETRSSNLSLLPTVGYYFPVKGNVKPYVQGAVGFASQNEKSGNIELKYSGLGYGAGAGVAYFFNKNVSIDLGLNYSASNLSNSEDKDAKIKSGGFSASVGFGIFL